jgi:peroxiredoxin
MPDEFTPPPRPEIPERESPLEPGELAPDFTLPAADAEAEVFELHLGDYVDGHRSLLVFYQDDGMPICTSELKAFAQEWELLESAGIKVLGVNTNGIGSHQRFQERDRFPFPLVSDFYGDVVKGYGMWDPDEGKSRRGVIALDEQRRVAYVLGHFNPGNINAFAEVFEALGLA